MIELKRILEAMIFVSGKPLSINEMLEVFMTEPKAQKKVTPLQIQLQDATQEIVEESSQETSQEASLESSPEVNSETTLTEPPAVSLDLSIPTKEELEMALNDLIDEWNDRNAAMYLMRVAQGYEFRTRSSFAPWVNKLNGQKPQKLSTSALEVLAIIAYRQPLTRAEIDEIRGVDSGGVLKNLLERRMIRLVGRKEEPGRPMLYGTSKDFLEIFSLKDLGELPPLRDFEEMVRRQTEEARVAQSTSVVLDDLLSSTEEILALEEGERELLDELDDGMKQLKSVEKSVLQSEQNTESQPSESAS